MNKKTLNTIEVTADDCAAYAAQQLARSAAGQPAVVELSPDALTKLVASFAVYAAKKNLGDVTIHARVIVLGQAVACHKLGRALTWQDRVRMTDEAIALAVRSATAEQESLRGK